MEADDVEFIDTSSNPGKKVPKGNLIRPTGSND
jgi:hypothetical protein